MAFNEFEQDTNKLFLHAVNVLLQVINERPIENEEDLQEIEEARFASSVLLETKREVLGDGWDFNTDINYSFSPDINGYITIPYNVLDISSQDGDLIMRDWRLYSKKDQSPVFKEPKNVDVVWDMAFNSLSQPVRHYITVRAARKFQARQIMDTNVYGYTKEDEEEAYIIARHSESRTGRYNMVRSQFGQIAGGR